MKKLIYTFIAIISLTTSSVFGQYTFSTNIQGQNGIDVDVTITFNQVVVNSANCNYGFNYQIQYDYDIHYNQFGNGNGNSDLNTLQGYLACGSGNQSFFNLPESGGQGTATTANNWTSQTDCNNIQVQDLMCDEIDLVVQGPGIDNQTIRLQAISTLPVEFIDFSAESTVDGNLLKWSTASEKNNAYFSVERSLDGSNWLVIDEVQGAGTTSEKSNYQLEDRLEASLVYYRLKQVDFDGTTTLLKTISVQNKFVVELSAYPNPATDFLMIKGVSHAADLMMIDATGKEQTDVVSITTTPENTLTVDISSLRPGIYFIRSAKGQLRFIKK